MVNLSLSREEATMLLETMIAALRVANPYEREVLIKVFNKLVAVAKKEYPSYFVEYDYEHY